MRDMWPPQPNNKDSGMDELRRMYIQARYLSVYRGLWTYQVENPTNEQVQDWALAKIEADQETLNKILGKAA